ncbi:formylglycine-generating enzyme family protein [Singulisphaera acidiphila]
MVLVPGGEFTMGNDEGETPERPAHRVFLSTYYIDQHEVSVRQFDLFEKEIGRRTDRVRALARETTIAPTSADSPVVMVNAKEAKDFATWAGKRLPTEAQWEMAARGSDGRLYPWGNDPLDWAKTRKARQIDPVMTYSDDVSPFGAYDMAGNAWEWTKDWYDSRYFVLVKNQKLSDPTGPTIVPRTLQLAVKGGSKSWTVTKREGMKYDQRLPFLGFRCVLAVEGPGNAFEPPPKPTTPGGSTPGLIDTGDAPPPF